MTYIVVIPPLFYPSPHTEGYIALAHRTQLALQQGLKDIIGGIRLVLLETIRTSSVQIFTTVLIQGCASCAQASLLWIPDTEFRTVSQIFRRGLLAQVIIKLHPELYRL
ncbi:hypothetical protein OG21DRAFT_1489513 [Imleria badia]|nr:hypothetical protein OG21DRAFT_1489513 [Imleria badia]